MGLADWDPNRVVRSGQIALMCAAGLEWKSQSIHEATFHRDSIRVRKDARRQIGLSSCALILRAGCLLIGEVQQLLGEGSDI